jgi:hypothetical protein
VVQEDVGDGDRQYGELRRVARDAAGRQQVATLTQEGTRRSNCLVPNLIPLGGKGESPTPNLSGDEGLGGIVVVRLESSGGEDPAVVGAAGPGPVLVDRTAVVDQHGAAPSLVVAEQHVAPR